MVQVNDVIGARQRTQQGKGAARKLRAAGLLPAVAYGPAGPSRLLCLDPKMFLLQRQQYGASHIYSVDLEGVGGTFKALIKHIDVDPLSRKMLHVDLYEVDMTRSIRVEVVLELVGKPAGLIDGGMLSQVLRRVEILVRPDQIPDKLVADVSPLKVGDSLHLSDVQLPAGVKLTAHGNEAVALLAEPEKAPEPTTPAGATPAAAAPAAAPAGGKK